MLLVCCLGATPADAADAVVRVNELNANIAGGCDLIELRVIRGGSMEGFQLWQRTTMLVTFTGLTVSSGDLVVVHTNATTCAGGAGNETLTKSQFPNASYPGFFDTAWDWGCSSSGLIATDNVITIYDGQGVIVDAVLAADGPTGTAAAASEVQAAAVAAAGHWTMIGGGLPPGGFIDDDFNSNAVQGLSTTGTSPSGASIQRIGDFDTNNRNDWGMPPVPTWGALNAGQNPLSAVAPGRGGGHLVVATTSGTGSSTVNLAFGAPLPTAARLSFFDLRGRRVHSMQIPAGAVEAGWNGRDSQGRAVGAGVYVAQLQTAHETAAIKLLLLR